MNLFRTSKLEIDVGGPSWLLFSCRCHKLAKKLQAQTGNYKEHVFKSGDEAMFKIKLRDLELTLTTLGLPIDLQKRIESSFKNWLQIDSGAFGPVSGSH